MPTQLGSSWVAQDWQGSDQAAYRRRQGGGASDLQGRGKSVPEQLGEWVRLGRVTGGWAMGLKAH